MSKESRSAKYKEIKSSKNNVYKLLPLVFLVMVYPLLVRYHSYNPDLNNELFYVKNHKWSDMFLWIKQIFLLVVSGCMVPIFFSQLYKTRKLKNTEIKYLYMSLFLIIYAFLALLSTITGGHTKYGLTGGMDMFESVFVLCTYAFIIIYSYIVIESKEEILTVLKSFMIGNLFVGLIGLSQALGNDFWMGNLGSWLVRGNAAINLSSTFGTGVVYSTLFNPNYVGTYTTIAFCVAFYLLTRSDRPIWKTIYIIDILLNVVMTLKSNSDAGIITMLFVFSCWIIYLIYRYIKHRRVVLLIGASTIVVILMVGFISSPISQKVYGKIIGNAKENYIVSDIDIEADFISITVDSKVIKASWTDCTQDLNFTDNSDEIIPYSIGSTNSTILLQPQDIDNITIQLITDENGNSGISYLIDDKTWSFIRDSKTEKYKYLNEYGKTLSLANYRPTIGKYDGMFTMRGYIWRHSISALKNTLLLGKGADSFIFQYDSTDYVGNARMGFTGQIMTKPHNLYIQVWTQTGLLSLICLLVFYICLLAKIIKRRNLETIILGISVILGFALISIINDSNLCTTPIFMVITGCLFAFLKIDKPQSLKPLEQSETTNE